MFKMTESGINGYLFDAQYYRDFKIKEAIETDTELRNKIRTSIEGTSTTYAQAKLRISGFYTKSWRMSIYDLNKLTAFIRKNFTKALSKGNKVGTLDLDQNIGSDGDNLKVENTVTNTNSFIDIPRIEREYKAYLGLLEMLVNPGSGENIGAFAGPSGAKHLVMTILFLHWMEEVSMGRMNIMRLDSSINTNTKFHLTKTYGKAHERSIPVNITNRYYNTKIKYSKFPKYNISRDSIYKDIYYLISDVLGITVISKGKDHPYTIDEIKDEIIRLSHILPDDKFSKDLIDSSTSALGWLNSNKEDILNEYCLDESLDYDKGDIEKPLIVKSSDKFVTLRDMETNVHNLNVLEHLAQINEGERGRIYQMIFQNRVKVLEQDPVRHRILESRGQNIEGRPDARSRFMSTKSQLVKPPSVVNHIDLVKNNTELKSYLVGEGKGVDVDDITIHYIHYLIEEQIKIISEEYIKIYLEVNTGFDYLSSLERNQLLENRLKSPTLIIKNLEDIKYSPLGFKEIHGDPVFLRIKYIKSNINAPEDKDYPDNMEFHTGDFMITNEYYMTDGVIFTKPTLIYEYMASNNVREYTKTARPGVEPTNVYFDLSTYLERT